MRLDKGRTLEFTPTRVVLNVTAKYVALWGAGGIAVLDLTTPDKTQPKYVCGGLRGGARRGRTSTWGRSHGQHGGLRAFGRWLRF